MASVAKEQLRRDLKDILKGADLSELSSKKVRKRLEAKYNVDLTDRKKEIDDLLMVLMQDLENGAASSDECQNNSSEESGRRSDGDHSSGEDSDFDVPEDIGPPKKKVKTSNKRNQSKPDSDIDQDDDEEMARRLQEEEGGARRTRSGGVKRRPPPKKTVQKTKKEGTKKKSTYSKPSLLSPTLAAIVGTNELPRSDVVKKLWDIAKERNLFDPKNRQFVICDDELYGLFGRKRVRMFGMMKHLSRHIYDKTEVVG
ncbi:hypothetical protein LSH36_80g02011 [Paralvinella palmiformis]|uniref:Upstream activation factor subunit spp27 n=1 Tax=Paralvinella palmiformis TaxID=53620 RepID=A0AAD9NCQ3_9ANNE|nr:hypothetical protein LSH36_80g02011 [Paralvinella palmiformis]